MTTPSSVDDRRKLHSGVYVEQSLMTEGSGRLERLIPLMSLPQGAIVADFGCGPGFTLDLIKSRIGHYYGVDFSEELVRVARERADAAGIRNATFVASSIAEFAMAHAAELDVALAMDVSEHVPDDEWRDALRSIRRALKPGGVLYLHTPNADFFLEMMKERNFIFRQFPVHIAVRDTADNTALLVDAGFEIRRVDLLPHYNVLRYLHPLSALPIVGKYLAARIFIRAGNPESVG